MLKYLNGALVANAASMGFNWIYNIPYLEKLSQTETLVFQKIDPLKYKRAGKSYLAYPNAQIGDVSAQGEISKWLYSALLLDKDMNRESYRSLVYAQIKPGGLYEGYVESYGKKLVFNKIVDELNLSIDYQEYHDDQLIGFIPYLVCKELGLPLDLAWELAQGFTDIVDYKDFYQVFDQLFNDLDQMSMVDALKKVSKIVPKKYVEPIKHALEMKDTNKFIIEHSGTACHIHHAIPLIFHILAHTNSYEDAVKLNVKIGGASCDRAMLIGAIYAQISDIPKDWLQKIKR